MLSQWIDPVDDYSESIAGQATTIGPTGRERVGLLLCTLLVLAVLIVSG